MTASTSTAPPRAAPGAPLAHPWPRHCTASRYEEVRACRSHARTVLGVAAFCCAPTIASGPAATKRTLVSSRAIACRTIRADGRAATCVGNRRRGMLSRACANRHPAGEHLGHGELTHVSDVEQGRSHGVTVVRPRTSGRPDSRRIPHLNRPHRCCRRRDGAEIRSRARSVRAGVRRDSWRRARAVPLECRRKRRASFRSPSLHRCRGSLKSALALGDGL